MSGALLRILHRAILGRVALMTLLACVAALAGTAGAQEERPQIAPGERKVTRKKEAGPRAVGVLRMTADGKVSLVPIAILVDGKFWDAGAYKADPVPMTLDTGVVYEGERAGNSLGLFTVGGALHSNAVNSPTPWIATGTWKPVGMETPAKSSKEGSGPDSAPVGMDSADEPPRLTHDPNAAKKDKAGAPTSPAGTPASGSTPSGSSGPSNQSGGDGPPRLTKGVPAPASTTSTPPSDSKTSDAKPGDSKSPDAKTSDAKDSGTKPTDAKADRANVPASDSGAGEANRPRLRRGKPAESFADEEVPGYSKPGSTSVTSTAAKPAAVAAAAEVDLVPAISDASGPIPRSLTYEWLKDEEGDRRKQLMDLAKDQLRAYIAEREKATIVPAPVHPQAAHSQPAHRAAKPPEPIFEKVQMIAYDLWNSNQPVIIFSAEAHMPPEAASAHDESGAQTEYSIRLVTYPDIYNNLHKLYYAVTDKFHLDVTPRLDLVDAVDADGDGRGELLFRKVSDAGTGWIIYRATADKLWKVFDSTSPE